MTKNDLERRYLDGFAQIASEFPKGVISKSESPDFLIQSDDHTIGIELTRLFRKSARGHALPREQESLRERIATEAKARYDAMTRPPIHVSIHFNYHPALRKADVSGLATRLIDLAVRLTPDVGGKSEEEYTWLNRAYFPEQIAVVSVHRPQVLTSSVWSTPSADYIRMLSGADIQKEIDKKDARVKSYRLQCERVWLVLCSRGERLSSYLEFTNEALARSYKTAFDRVFLYVWSSRVHELAVARADV